MKKLLGALNLYLFAWGIVGFCWFDWTNAAAERGRHAIALGEQHAQQLKAPDALAPLEDACKDKLEPGAPRSIAAYVAKSSLKLPSDDNAWDQVVVGFHHVLRDDIVREGPGQFTTVDWPAALLGNVNPLEWANHLDSARAGSPELGSTRYLVVARYFSLSPPANEGTDGYTRGGGDFSARVLGFPDGEVLCEGRGEVHMKEAVNASGRAATREAAQTEALANAARRVPFVFSLAVTTSPLHALCDVGGDPLCKLTGQWVGK
jgi:hypothetical protein